MRMDGALFNKGHQFSSFQKEVILSKADWVPDIAERLIEQKIQCISFDSLLKKTNGREVDLLQIDTEGYDLAILKIIDFSRMHPSVICYEHANLSKAQQEEANILLIAQGYRLTRDNLDSVALSAP